MCNACGLSCCGTDFLWGCGCGCNVSAACDLGECSNCGEMTDISEGDLCEDCAWADAIEVDL